MNKGIPRSLLFFLCFFGLSQSIMHQSLANQHPVSQRNNNTTSNFRQQRRDMSTWVVGSCSYRHSNAGSARQVRSGQAATLESSGWLA
ncbi:hypothetical protein K440DRAFT_629864 [Wilcoxina mikolae CBS 423.85]|nr:hypothetical protein K440DRAFT_629864 [Wilcoxina mikolae CBS 423.85]